MTFMKNFIRSIRYAEKYWASLIIASLCSIAVAGLWGANIGAFYPILEVTIRGKSVDTWFQEQLEHQRSQIVAQSSKRLALELSRYSPESERPNQVKRLRQLRAESASELNYSIRRYQLYLQAYPWIKRFVPEAPFHTIVMIVAVLMGSTVVKHFLTIVSEALVGRVSLDMARDLRRQLFHQALFLDRAQFTKQGASKFQSQITYTTDLVCAGTQAIFGAAIREPLKLLACLIGAAWICPRLLLMSLIVAPVLGSLLYIISKKIRANTRRILSQMTGYQAIMIESLGNVQTIQAYQMEGHEENRFAQVTLAARKYGLRSIILSSLSKPVIEMLGVGMLGVTIIGGSYLVLTQQTSLLGIPVCSEPLSVSALLIFFAMLIGASDPLRRLSSIYSQVYTGIVAAESVYQMIDQPSALHEPATPKRLPDRHRVLKLNNLSFGYREDQQTLSNVTLEIPFGRTVAIVGHNGSGKSTMINLLCRFYDPVSGSITIDDVDYRDVSLSDLRSKFGLVNQQTELFNDTVAYNIRYGQPTATDEQVRWAAQQAHADEFIETALQDKYETSVGVNGQKLSGGQRQRIALARALLRNPEILILDEATSQIDMRSEQLIRQSLAEHRGERTMIIITHREKLLELADEIYEMQSGRLVRVNQADLPETSEHRAA